MNVGVVHIKRSRDSFLQQFRVGANVGDFLHTHARAKRMKRDAFTIYDGIHDMNTTLRDGACYYLTWQPPRRGGGASITTTETWQVPLSNSSSEREQTEAQVALRELEYFVQQLSMALHDLRLFRRAHSMRAPQIVHLRDWCRMRAHYRGGAPKAMPTKRETTTTEQGLQLRTEIVPGEAREPMKPLNVELFAQGATGYCLLAWESWQEKRHVVSEKLLLAIIPGQKKQQILAYGLHPEPLIEEKEVVFKAPTGHAEDPWNYFVKKVTVVVHMTVEKKIDYKLLHHGQTIQLTLQHAKEVLVDLYADSTAQSQVWTNAGMKATIKAGLQSWSIHDTVNVQWATLRCHEDTARATVLVRCGDPQRIVMLRRSGTALLYTRERVNDPSVPEYTTVWMQMGPEAKQAVGVINAQAQTFQGHWGIARNARSFGLRVAKDKLTEARRALRPEDKSINEHNCSIAPSKRWVLKGVSAEATASELSSAVCPTWPILPIRALTQRKARATWLIEAERNPLVQILETSSGIIVVEEFQQGRQKVPKTEPGKGKGKAKGQGAAQPPAMLASAVDVAAAAATSGRSAGSGPKQSGQALKPSKSQAAASVRQDPLEAGDPWSGYKRGSTSSKEGASAASQSTSLHNPGEAQIMVRLYKAEAAIERIETRQDASEKQLNTMQSFMSDRFQEVMAALNGLHEPKRKVRADENDGRGE